MSDPEDDETSSHSTSHSQSSPTSEGNCERNSNSDSGSIEKKEKSHKESSKGRLRKEAEAYRKKLEKRGVIYMSRIPPFMKPNKARTLFEQYGEVTRIYLAEEDNLHRKKRKEHGGNGSKQFTEGWVEFADKNVAKEVADSLNNTPIGGKKSSFYHDDIWNLKYLRKFKWDYLTEKMAYERRVKEMKLRAAMMQAKRSNAEIAEQIERGAVQQHIEQRKRQKTSDSGGSGDGNGDGSGGSEAGAGAKLKRKFRQEKPIAESYGERRHKVKPGVLRKIFAQNKQ